MSNKFKELVEHATKSPTPLNEGVSGEANHHLQRAALFKRGADMLASAGYDKAAAYYNDLAKEAGEQAVEAV